MLVRVFADGVFGVVTLGATAVAVGMLGSVVAPPHAVQLGVLAVALLLLRRPWPGAALVGLATVAGAMPHAALLAAVGAYEVGRRLRGLARPAVLLGACALTVVAAWQWLWLAEAGGWRAPGTGLMVALIAVAGPGLVGTTVGQQEQVVQALREQNAAAEGEARLAERSRIAAEMHDLLGHRLSLISLYAGGLELGVAKASPELKEEAGQLRRTAGTAMDELRDVLGVLGPVRDGATDATGTRADLQALVDDSAAASQRVTLAWSGPDLAGVPVRVRRALHRVVREALTNAHRYAPGAAVTVAVEAGAASVAVRIVNAGGSGEPLDGGTGRGLVQLRERVEVLGGSLECGPADGGFAVAARIPLGGVRGAVVGAGGGPVRDVLTLLPRLAAGAVGLASVGALLLVGLVGAATYVPAGPGERPVVPEDGRPRLGMGRAEVEAVVGPDEPSYRAAAMGREPARPRGAECLYPYPGRDAAVGRLPVVRYCFGGGRLVEIARFSVPTSVR
ncbi:hypothetical protein SRB5_38590 [Streptomyces sp. RB5]|uniref:histidine kinase n=1 Tax=Streptomyces smaragdinus TaxID=2585196 RepID=A0A7K0CJP4_9ACTN|nr:histidine kinase [Streptomyces smaragdinus]MQY13709.1 hypothetical protein [Streptomyces smaragdinus]